jgi:hypothetical protein
MGYHLSILRTAEGRKQPIRRDELASVVAARADLQLEEGPRRSLIRTGAGPEPVLVYQDGEIWARDPARATVELMLELASVLGARVRGDELETYRTPDDTFTHPDDRRAIAEAKASVRRMRAKARLVSWSWFAAALILAGAAGLAVDRCTRGG